MHLELNKFVAGYLSRPVHSTEINVRLKKGEVLLMLGPNGSGKSTVLKTLVGLIPQVGGERDFVGKIGWAPTDNKGFFPYLNGRENLSFYWESKNGDSLENFLVDFKSIELLDSILNKKFDQQSSGMKQILKIILAFFPDNEIIVLDEPLKSLSPKLKDVIVDLLLKFQKDKIIVIADHVVSDYVKLESKNVFIQERE